MSGSRISKAAGAAFISSLTSIDQLTERDRKLAASEEKERIWNEHCYTRRLAEAAYYKLCWAGAELALVSHDDRVAYAAASARVVFASGLFINAVDEFVAVPRRKKCPVREAQAEVRRWTRSPGAMCHTAHPATDAIISKRSEWQSAFESQLTRIEGGN